MIWLTWRQHRKQALYTLIAFVVLAAVMLPTGLAMHHSFTNSGLAACLAKLSTATVTSGDPHDCGALSEQFQNQYSSMTFIAILFVILPAIVGMFFGAPLIAREVEAGTHRLVWTQGVQRRHWALVKFGVIGAVTLVLAAAYTLGMDWWSEPLVANGGRLGPIVFDIEGIAPIGYTLFAVALGILASTTWKKVLPAMGITLAGYAVVRILIETFARPHYMRPLTASIPITSTQQFNNNSADWIMSNGVINGVGKLVMPNASIGCGSPDGNAAVAGAVPSASDPCGGGGLVSQGLGPGPFSNWQQYQPASRFWAFQSIETGIFLALAAVLVYLAVRRIRRIS
jgi:ABC-type transport system involved in multi-copper enzyme maturation permease subunit